MTVIISKLWRPPPIFMLPSKNKLSWLGVGIVRHDPFTKIRQLQLKRKEKRIYLEINCGRSLSSWSGYILFPARVRSVFFEAPRRRPGRHLCFLVAVECVTERCSNCLATSPESHGASRTKLSDEGGECRFGAGNVNNLLIREAEREVLWRVLVPSA